MKITPNCRIGFDLDWICNPNRLRILLLNLKASARQYSDNYCNRFEFIGKFQIVLQVDSVYFF